MSSVINEAQEWIVECVVEILNQCSQNSETPWAMHCKVLYYNKHSRKNLKQVEFCSHRNFQEPVPRPCKHNFIGKHKP